MSFAKICHTVGGIGQSARSENGRPSVSQERTGSLTARLAVGAQAFAK